MINTATVAQSNVQNQNADLSNRIALRLRLRLNF